ncbi:ATP-binding protein [Streptomyces sp. ESR1.13]|uniref:ATP-binding protein n=1 Tax=Streptomyces TaxID=1883 RepID=UPI0006E3108F|nr:MULTISPECIES: ATP-binding protein [Streptomyces]MCL7368168.1 ATP-binding protein [Streptomyces ardesiacus]
MTELIVTVTAVLAVAGVGAAWYFRRKGEQARRRAEQLRDHADRLTLQLVAAEQCVGHLASTVIPAVAKGGPGGAGPEGGLPVPAQLDGTPLAERLRAVPGAVAAVVGDVRAQERTAAQQAADHAVEQVRHDAERQIAQVRHEAVGVARAAVRGFANNVVARAAKLGRAVSQGVRRHISDEAYATLVEIDHLAQQMLLTASGYAVLAGDKLSRRWPATTLTDIVRAAMGRIEGYERIRHPEMGSVVVEGRAVEAVVHALAVLLDNALRYSPPAASVHVSLEQGHHACFLIVDDAGLRMDDERLLWASDVMSGEQRDDITRLGAHPQTGLRVASLLAENYGFRVELTAPNIYQGTRAMVVLPKNLIVDPSAAQPAPQAVSRALPQKTAPAAAQEADRDAPEAPGRTAATPPATPSPTPVSAPEPAVPAAVPASAVPSAPSATPAAPSATTTASGLTVRRRSTAPAPVRRPAAPDDTEPGRPAVAAAWAAGTRRGREGEPPSQASADAIHTPAAHPTPHDGADDEGH